MKTKKHSKQKGFTLVELSIVLVIIGLIVGGVLVGQSLIATAKLQNDINRMQQLDSATNTFNLRYGCLPGDCSTAASFFTGTPTIVNGNGNGTIHPTAANDAYTAAAGGSAAEFASYYAHLGAAELVQVARFDVTANTNNASNAITAKSGGYFLVGSNSSTGNNTFHHVGVTLADASHTISRSATLTPPDASFVDLKLDDGKPLTGIAQSRATVWTAGDAVPASFGATDCSTSTAYNLGLTTKLCSIRVRASS